jgi:NitT/TauT family transport system substrate-binding protein
MAARHSHVAAGFALCAALLAAGFAPQAARADDTLSVILGTGLPPLMDTLDLVAQGAGFYKTEHLTVTKVFASDAAAVADACATGKADICPLDIERVFTGYESGVPLELFGAWASRYTYVLAVPADSPIKTLADFKGKAIGVHQLGVGNKPFGGQTAVTTALAAAGLTKDDYTFVPIGFNQPAMDALTSGRVAGAGFPRYELIPFQVAGTKLRIFENPLFPDTPSGGYAAAPATIQTKGDALARFMRAIDKAALVVRYNPAGAARLMLQTRGNPYTEDDVAFYAKALTLWEDALPARDPANRRIGYIPIQGEELYSKLLQQYGVTKAQVPVAAVVTNQFNAFANDFDHRAVEAFAKTLPTAAPAPATPLKLVLGTGLPPLMDTLDLVAQGAGFYAAEGVTVSKFFVPDAAAAVDACATGTADICPIDIERVFSDYEQGRKVRLFLARVAKFTYVMAVLDDSPIKTLADFKGKAIGVHQLGDGSRPFGGEIAVATMLGAGGLTRADYTFTPIGFNETALANLTSGKVAGAGFPLYEFLPFEAAGTKLRVFENPLLKDVVTAGYGAAPATIATKGDALAHFSRAIVKAALLVRLNPGAAARLLLQAHGEPFTDADVARYTQLLTLWEDALLARDPANPRIGYIDPAGDELYGKLLQQYGVLKQPAAVSDVVTNQFNAFANDFDHRAIEALAQHLP